ncbi:toll/interleukin-1 receptor domain-containing protein [Vibrio algivorus]|uniref:Toll/interleukin-1 receptor domain-containing protein n=1 Tax=Vibrio algivorus TaxID=1667024 RepID=A0A557PFK1_9VIBR|nr:toll/interleukin-1 receptor domain-containing protein [Vibrio algivorus]TVO39445.1 toll/interleukin-1 receptor domain-containing protein [Vibrio algivorus]
MGRCTAPRNGHRTASGRENCPECSNRGYGFYSSPFSTNRSLSGNIRTSHNKPSWSRSGSSVIYTASEIRSLTPVRKNIEKRALKLDLRDIFLCHAWDDRKGIAKELHDLLESLGVSVWFSEKDIPLGTNLLREIDKGLAKSKVGIVIVTPAFLNRIAGEGIADKELSALLATDLLVPIVHGTTYDALRDVSPLLGSRSGLNTSEDSLNMVATKLAELVTV